MLVLDVTQFAGLSGIPLVAALVQLVKGMFPNLDGRWWPGVSLVMGVLWNLGLALAEGVTDVRMPLVVGFVTGLSASGLYTWLRPPGASSTSSSGSTAPK